MAIDNLNFLVQWAPAGQQMDKYSENPGMIVSKNADIFSSSRSVKATAFSAPETLSNEIVDIDETGRFELHSNGRVWDNRRDAYVYSDNFNLWSVKTVNYSGSSLDPSIWTPLKLFVERNDDNSDYKTLTVVTDKIIFVREKEHWTNKVKIKNLKYCTLEADGGIKADWSHSYLQFDIDFETPGYQYAGVDLYLRKEEYQYGEHLWNAEINYVRAYRPNLIYDANNDRMVTKSVTNQTVSYNQWENPQFDTNPSNRWYGDSNRVGIMNYYVYPEWVSQNWALRVRIDLTREDSTYFNGKIYIDYDDYFYSYTMFLPYVRNRIAKKSGEYYVVWCTKSTGLYQFTPVYDVEDGETVTYSTLLRYDFKEMLDLPAYHWLEVVDVVVTDTNIYRFWNNRGVGYISIFPPIAGDEWEHFTYPGIEFIWAIRLNHIIYVIANNRWVSTLYAYNGAELVPIISGTIKVWVYDLIEYREQYRFSKINEWRWNIIIWTSDNQIFMYWPSAGGKAMSKIHSLPDWATISEILPVNDTLKVMYKLNNTPYQTIFQDNVAIKNYNTEWMVAYPIKIWNHLLEKEEADLQVSYILPSDDCKIELRGLANHYHFWTFTSSENITFTVWESYKMKWCIGDYTLKFIERNDDQYTFELVGDLPTQTNNQKKITDTSWNNLMNYTEFNHFRKIWEIASEWYDEGYIRFHNISNLLNFPKTHSLEVMVKWKWTTQFTPEVFTINLIASQRDRW